MLFTAALFAFVLSGAPVSASQPALDCGAFHRHIDSVRSNLVELGMEAPIPIGVPTPDNSWQEHFEKVRHELALAQVSGTPRACTPENVNGYWMTSLQVDALTLERRHLDRAQALALWKADREALKKLRPEDGPVAYRNAYSSLSFMSSHIASMADDASIPAVADSSNSCEQNAKVLVEAFSSTVEPHVAGDVTVQVSLDEDGHVGSTKITKTTSTDLSQEALSTVSRSTFKPAIHDCEPIPSHLIMVVHLTGSPPAVHTSPEPSARNVSSRDYARFCHVRPAYYSGLGKSTINLTINDAIAREAQSRLHLLAAPAIVARDAEALFVGANLFPEEVLLTDRSASNPRWWRATLDSHHAITMVAPIDSKFVSSRISFPRSMASYVVFNDLLGGDEPFPRAGCADIFGAWFAMFPAVAAELQSAIARPPEQNATLTASVRAAWSALRNKRTESSEEWMITGDTIDRIGSDPEVTIVFRDRGLPGDGIGEFDVVRIGGAQHTYAMVSANHPIVLTAPLCVVGDTRCASYYVWP